jgi:hypothetical protein
MTEKTLGLKVDGNQGTFVHGSALWTSTDALGVATDLTLVEAKSPAFWTVPMTQVRVVMRDRSVDRNLTAGFNPPPGTPTTLRALFVGPYYPTSNPRSAWLGLVSSGSLQTNCQQQGLNAVVAGQALRIGIFGNQEADCNSCDSFLGIGHTSYASGNIAAAAYDNSGAGGRDTSAPSASSSCAEADAWPACRSGIPRGLPKKIGTETLEPTLLLQDDGPAFEHAHGCDFYREWSVEMFVTKLVTWASAFGILLDGCGPDTTPDAFTFVDERDVEVSTVVESDPVIVTGINEPAPVHIVAGEYSIDGQPYTAADGAIEDGQAVRVRLTSAEDYNATSSATLTIDGVSDSFDVTTLRDVEPPAASISFPHLDETWVQGLVVVVRGVASDNVQVASVTVNGVAATSSDGFATWQARVPLARGQATEIAVTVTDIHDNVVHAADSITVHAHTLLFGRACGTFSYDLASNRMFSRFPLAETRLSDGTVTRVSSPTGSTSYTALPLYDDVQGRLYAIGNDGTLVEVDLTSYKAATIISPEGRDGISMGPPSNAVLDQANGIVYSYSANLAAVVSIRVADGARSIVAGETVGIGPGLEYPTYLAFGGSRLFAATGYFNPPVLEIDLANGSRTVISGDGIGSGSDFLSIQGLAADGTGSAIYVADIGGDLFAVDSTDGTRTIVSPAIEGLLNGAVFEQGLGMQFVVGNGAVLVSDCEHGQLLSIDPHDGARSILTPPFRGDGPPLISPVAIALRQGGDALITLNRKGDLRQTTGGNNLIVVATMTGNRAIVANAAVGSGDAIADVLDLVEDSAHGRYLVTDWEARAIIAIDPDTGDRAILSDNVSHGAGVEFMFPLGIAIDTARNRAVVVEPVLKALIGVDLETGDRTIITQVGRAGSGDDFATPNYVEIDAANDRAFVTDWTLNAVFSVDLSSGARTILSGDTAGSGAPLQEPVRMAFDPVNNRIIVINDNLVGVQNMLAYIDADTGNREFRTITGMISQPQDMVFDPGPGLLYFIDMGVKSVHALDYESSMAVIISQ